MEGTMGGKIAIGAREQFLKEPAFLDLDAPVKICGDTHGQYGDLLRIFDYAGKPDNHNYLFLGDYVDRGKQSLETVVLLFCYKLKYPNNFFLLRGNHESAAINRIYGFYDECKRRFSVKLWKSFQDSFNCMPIAALVGGKIFCMHGGLSPHLSSWDQIRRVQRPTDVPDNGIICDLLWSDPDMKVTGYKASRRGISYLFGDDVVHEFCAKMNIDLVVRAHQVVEDGYEFFANRKLVTIFSAPNYCGMFQNAAVVINVAKNLECEFQILKPQDTKAVVEQKIKS